MLDMSWPVPPRPPIRQRSISTFPAARQEEGHRSPLPIWLKLPAVALVVLGLVLIKNALAGFTTVFPMIGVVAAYEARGSLWTISRQMPVVMVTITAMMMVIHVAEPRIGIGWSLALGWVVFFLTVLPFTRASMNAGRQTRT